MRVETVVIGAGAAGIAAGQLLRAHGRDVLVLEARSRIGGRALTRRLIGNICFDAGCEWLHSADRNRLLTLARELGFTISKVPSSWSEPSIDTNFPLAAQMEFNAACAAFYDRLEVASNLSHVCRSMAGATQSRRRNRRDGLPLPRPTSSRTPPKPASSRDGE